MKKSWQLGRDFKNELWKDEGKNKNLSKLYASFDQNEDEKEKNEGMQESLGISLKLSKAPSVSSMLQEMNPNEITMDDLSSNIFLRRKIDLKLKKNKYLSQNSSKSSARS